MYYIYEIKGVKIGCTTDIQRRQKEQLSKGKMILLETHTNIEQASKRERQLQEEKGYRVDSNTFSHSVNNAKTVCHSKEAIKKRESKQNKIEISRGRQRGIIAIDVISNSVYTFTGLGVMKRWMEDKHKHKFNLSGVYGNMKGKNNHYKGYRYKYVSPIG